MPMAMPVMRLPAAPGVVEPRLSRPRAFEAVLLGVRGLLREAEESGPVGDDQTGGADLTEVVVSQPRAIARPTRAVD